MLANQDYEADSGLNAIFAACVRSQGFWQFPLSWKRRIGGMARSNAPVGSRAAATLADQRSSPALPAMSVPPRLEERAEVAAHLPREAHQPLVAH